MDHEELAYEFRDLVFSRTNINPFELVCPREKYFMTPCIARDGGLSVSDDGACVGCGHSVDSLMKKEMEKHASNPNR